MTRDMIAGAILLVASAGYYVLATQLPISLIDTSIGSSALPELLGIGGMGLSVVLIVTALIERRKAAAAAGGNIPAAATDWEPHRRAAGVLAIVVLYVLLLNTLGYFLALVITIASLAHYQGKYYKNTKRPMTALVIAVVGALIFWLVFAKILGVPMPQGFWRHVF